MIIRNGTVAEFVESVASKKLFVYGAGKNANEFFSKYQMELAGVDICAVIDNNLSERQNDVSLCGRVLPVISEGEFSNLELNESKTVILLTIGDFWDVLASLENNPALSSLNCYIYPLIRFEENEKGIFDVRIPLESFKMSGEFLIPKIIHYCWFGHMEMPALSRKCIESWKKFCPDFEIRLWNEYNYDVTKNPYMLAAYRDRKWAYVSDYARIDVINEYGGVYLDTDVEILRPLDILLREKAFAGFESEAYVAFGLGFGAMADNPILCDLLKLYAVLPWDGGRVACPIYQTNVLEKHGLIRQNSFQRMEDMTILPVRYLSPKSVNSGRIHYFPDSFAIHHYAASWVSDNVRRWNQLKKRVVYDSGN